jgi:hypothetical protein
MKITRAQLSVTFALATTLAACGTNTPIGKDDTAPRLTGTAGATSSGAAGEATSGGTGGALGSGAASGTYFPSSAAAHGGSGVLTADAGVSTSSGTGGSPAGTYDPGTMGVTAGDKAFVNPTGTATAYVGYFENYMFLSGSDAVHMTFGKDAQGKETLNIVLGDGPPVAPATDGTQFWPPIPPELAKTTFTDGLGQFIEGYSYPAHEVVWQGARLRFKLASKEAWTPWCSLQTSYANPDNPSAFNCIPGTGGGASGDGQCAAQTGPMTQTPVPCAQFWLCLSGQYCSCNATGCGPNPDHNIAFDLTFGGGLVSGSATVDGLHNVHMMPTN